jgi:hypothetical protein
LDVIGETTIIRAGGATVKHPGRPLWKRLRKRHGGRSWTIRRRPLCAAAQEVMAVDEHDRRRDAPAEV